MSVIYGDCGRRELDGPFRGVHTSVHMATVYKRGKVWWARWYKTDGTRTSKTTGSESKREARTIAASLEADDRKLDRLDMPAQARLSALLDESASKARRGKLSLGEAAATLEEMKEIANPSYRAITFEECAKEWLEIQKAALGTVENYRGGLNLVIWALGNLSKVRIQELEIGHLDKAVAKIRKDRKDLKASTVNIGISVTRRMMSWAVKRRFIQTSPAEELENLPETDSDVRAPFTLPEIAAMIEHGKGAEWAGLVILGAHTGLRLGDLRALKSGDIENGRIVLTTAKTGKVVQIPLTPDCLDWIGDKTGPLFPKLREWSASTTSNYFKRVMTRSAVPDKVPIPGGKIAKRSFHSLRHTFTSWLADAGVLPEIRMKLTGHTKADTHATYSHFDEALNVAIAHLPSVRGKVTE